jgi:NADPH:quinone reductase-like Zn-dependent oxidoreductase
VLMNRDVMAGLSMIGIALRQLCRGTRHIAFRHAKHDEERVDHDADHDDDDDDDDDRAHRRHSRASPSKLLAGALRRVTRSAAARAAAAALRETRWFAIGVSSCAIFLTNVCLFFCDSQNIIGAKSATNLLK